MCLGINVYLEICDSNRLWEEVGFIFLDSSTWMLILFQPFHGIHVAPLSKVPVVYDKMVININNHNYFWDKQCLGVVGTIRE